MDAITAPTNSQAEIVPRAPSRLMLLAEGRFVLERAAFRSARRRLAALPRGDGHAVLVLPGFLASDRSTAALRAVLGDLGYQAHGWGFGRNTRVDLRRVKQMEQLVKELRHRTGRKVSLIGWSLGGIFARELAKLDPGSVRQVITLGSPIRDDRRHTNASGLFELVNGKEPELLRQGRFAGLHRAPPVPTTTILSRGDGIVHWTGSVQQTGCGHEHTENIVVRGSHLGLVHNPAATLVIADRLRQAENQWQPFVPPAAHRWMFPLQELP